MMEHTVNISVKLGNTQKKIIALSLDSEVN